MTKYAINQQTVKFLIQHIQCVLLHVMHYINPQFKSYYIT